jgi:Protein of unknown function (DUF2852)
MGCCGFGLGRWNRPANGMRPSEGVVMQPSSSSRQAFDEYRAETLRRLEQEEREFREFLERTRMAKDRNEFDQFMAERRARPQP